MSNLHYIKKLREEHRAIRHKYHTDQTTILEEVMEVHYAVCLAEVWCALGLNVEKMFEETDPPEAHATAMKALRKVILETQGA